MNFWKIGGVDNCVLSILKIFHAQKLVSKFDNFGFASRFLHYRSVGARMGVKPRVRGLRRRVLACVENLMLYFIMLIFNSLFCDL
ncbi:hypothetical protein HMPREF1640_05395 [Prevotella sp. S7-1-8]|nr:hypothetical protein HMPREF1640_05395 [Prevotella sp. S7-1-8]